MQFKLFSKEMKIFSGWVFKYSALTSLAKELVHFLESEVVLVQMRLEQKQMIGIFPKVNQASF